jgi:hypothetical protein
VISLSGPGAWRHSASAQGNIKALVSAAKQERSQGAHRPPWGLHIGEDGC